MNKDEAVIVSVGTGRYTPGLLRLTQACREQGFRVMASNELPFGSPPHSEVPYAFKAYALSAARTAGYRYVLWADASVVPIAPLEPIFQYASEHGAWISKNWWRNYDWTADSAYPKLFPHLDIAAAREMNRVIWHVAATTFCLDLSHGLGDSVLERYAELANSGAFVGPWFNSNHPESSKRPGAAPCGPSDVLGHRHDQTALSVIAWENNIELTDPPKFFAYRGTETEETILLVDGAVNA